MASLIDDNAELAEIAGAEFTVNYAMLYQFVPMRNTVSLPPIPALKKRCHNFHMALDINLFGRMSMSQKPDSEIQKVIQQFAVKYGLFGLMTALFTTSNFMEYEDWKVIHNG